MNDGIMIIAGGVLLSSAIFVSMNKGKASYIISSILGIIGIGLLYFGLFYIPSTFNSLLSYNSPNSSFNPLSTYGNGYFTIKILESFYVPSIILSTFGLFFSFDYFPLVAGVLFSIGIILHSFDVISVKMRNFFSVLSLLIFSIGEIISGTFALLSSSINSFSIGNNLFYELIIFTTSNSILVFYQVFQYMAILTSVLIIISGGLFLVFSVLNFIHSLPPLIEEITSGKKENQPVTNELKIENF